MKDFLENDIFIGSHVVTCGGGVNKKAIVTRLHEQCVSLRLYDGSTGVAYPENLIVIETPVLDLLNQELKVDDKVVYRTSNERNGLRVGVVAGFTDSRVHVCREGVKGSNAYVFPKNIVKLPL